MDVLSELTGIRTDDAAFNRIPLMRPKGCQTSSTDTFGELCDAFEEAILSGMTSNGQSGVGLSTRSIGLGGSKQDSGVVTPGFVPDTEASIAECDLKWCLPAENFKELVDMFLSLMSQARQVRQGRTVEKYVSTIGKLNDIIPSSVCRQHPSVTLPAFENKDPNENMQARGEVFAQGAAQIFHLFHTSEEFLDIMLPRLSAPPPPFPGMSSSPEPSYIRDQSLCFFGNNMPWKVSSGAHLQSRIERDLSSALLIKFEHSNVVDDLGEAIRYATSTLERTPTDDALVLALLST